MNEHTVLCACLLQWVKMEPVSCPESWRSTAPISNRKWIIIIPRQFQHMGVEMIETFETLNCYTSVLGSVHYLFSLSLPCMRRCCGTPASAGQDPRKCSFHLLHTLQLWRHRLCVPDKTVHPQCRLKLPAAKREAASRSHKFQGSHLLCVTAGPVARAEGRLCLLGLLRDDKMWQLALCRSQAHFVLWHRLPGRMSPCQVTQQDYPRASGLIKTS